MKNKDFLLGIAFVATLSIIAFFIAGIESIKRLSLSPLIIGIILGMVFANTGRKYMPEKWTSGMKFCTKQILRTGIVFYGWRLTLDQVAAIGVPAIICDAIIISGTIGLGLFLGKMLKIDRDTALITSTGSAICGAAAVLGAEPVVKCESHKTAIAISTVVIFGTLSMFLYPIMYRCGILSGMTDTQVAIYTGSTLHEVAHVAGAGNAMDPSDSLGIAGTATITKMIRVIMLAPVLIIMAFCLRRKENEGENKKITIPWFALNFVVVIIINTILQNLSGLPQDTLGALLYSKSSWMELLDTFLLTMAMTALGCDTSASKFRQAGARPFYLAGGLYIWLVAGGYFVTKFITTIL